MAFHRLVLEKRANRTVPMATPRMAPSPVPGPPYRILAMAKELICETCGKAFIVLSDMVQKNPKHCRICYQKWRDEKERERKEAEDLRRQEQKNRDRELFEKEIQAYCPVSVNDIDPSEHTLYVLGNGFDLMHRVPSSYYNFRDSLGKNNYLRETLEIALTPEDIWADFEESLGHLDMDLMAGRHIVDMWLDDFGYYDDEAGAAEFYMAVEAAAAPIAVIADKLQPAYRRWVEKLCVGTDDRPLKTLIRSDGKVLCFNYTEFVETLYGAENVCYIHGCRKNRKQELILGHRPGIESEPSEANRKARNYHQAVVDIAQGNVLGLIAQCDKDLTKDAQTIIRDHRSFFDSLKDVDRIIVIGHSLSSVDWDYFKELNRLVPNAHWYFGTHGLNDLKNLKALTDGLQINNFTVFRTDGIRTEPKKTEAPDESSKTSIPIKKYRHDRTEVVAQGFDLKIRQDGEEPYEAILPSYVKQAIIFENNLFIVLDDLDGDILLFRKTDQNWSFIDQLRAFGHQNLINRRLKHVYITESDITFVYNNRIRIYSLKNGELIRNKQVQNAKDRHYPGTDIMGMWGCYLFLT